MFEYCCRRYTAKLFHGNTGDIYSLLRMSEVLGVDVFVNLCMYLYGPTSRPVFEINQFIPFYVAHRIITLFK